MIAYRTAALLVAVATLLAACSSGPGVGGQLEGTEWILRSYAFEGQLAVVPETEYADAEFDRHRVTGVSGCNRYDALARTGGRTMLVSKPAVTLMACDEDSMAFEQAFLANLEASRWYSVRRDVLTIFGVGGDTLLVFDASPRNPLLGTWVVDSFSDAPGSVSAPLEATALEVVFGLASVGGFAGCNSFSGTYGTNGNVVRVSRLATTLLACDEPVMAQEAAFLEALQGVAFLDRQGDAMLLTDRSGSLSVALTRPVPPPAAEPSPEPSGQATAEPTEGPTDAPTAEATATPTEAPTTAPTAVPTATPAPTVPTEPAPPIILPTVATCELQAPDGTTLATIVYPGIWFTVPEPPELTCRYFDPDSITVPDDPTTLSTAITITTAATPYTEAVATATDPAAWTVRQRIELVVDGLAATLVEAEAIEAAAGIPGSSRIAYLLDYGAAGTMTLATTGDAGSATYAPNAAILTLMVGLSTFTAPGG